ncbi:MAG: glycoside hydrolase family 127 protein [Bacteroidales bacterium]
MIKSLGRYFKFFTHTILDVNSRKLVVHDFQRYYFDKKKVNHQTAYPWEWKNYHESDKEKALEKAIAWLLYAQESMVDEGFGSYHLLNGWSSSYVETTGYIIPTLLQYGILKNNSDIIRKALAAADWLITVQKESGGWQGECIDDNRAEVVFNSGQVIRGLYAAYEYTKETRYLQAAVKGCDWLCAVQEADGRWVKNAFMQVARVYDSYVDAPLLKMYELTGNEKYKETAVKNLQWIVEKKQLPNGWLEDCDNTVKNNHKPIIHTISYTIDGLLDSGIMLNDKKLIDAAVKSANQLLSIFNSNHYLKGRFDREWQGSEYIITTGCAQIALVWMKLYKRTQRNDYFQAAQRMNNLLLFIQDRALQEERNTKGAMPGSFPIWGKYESFGFPNWATKYWADSLMMEQSFLPLQVSK